MPHPAVPDWLEYCIMQYGFGYARLDYKADWINVKEVKQTEFYALSECKFYSDLLARDVIPLPIILTKERRVRNGNHRLTAFEAAQKKRIPALVVVGPGNGIVDLAAFGDQKFFSNQELNEPNREFLLEMRP